MALGAVWCMQAVVITLFCNQTYADFCEYDVNNSVGQMCGQVAIHSMTQNSIFSFQSSHWLQHGFMKTMLTESISNMSQNIPLEISFIRSQKVS